MNKSERQNRVIVALDVPDLESCNALLTDLGTAIRFFKVGNELFTACGQEIIQSILNHGSNVFLDLKFYDIPNTVAGASRVVTRLGVQMFNLHATGGVEMMHAAREAADEEAAKQNSSRPIMLGVTVLTSFSEEVMQASYGTKNALKDQVLHLAEAAKEAGLDGVVASAQESSMIKERLGEDFLTVTPGIRPKEGNKGDQSRVLTPKEAFDNGSDYIVIGRPITQAPSPREAALKILDELE